MFDHRSNGRLEQILQQVLDCVDPTRCVTAGDNGTPPVFAWSGVEFAEPEPLQACSSLTIWEQSKTPSQGSDCFREYTVTVGINVAIFCAGALPQKDRSGGVVVNRDERARTAKRLNALVDTILDCLHCSGLFERCNSFGGVPVAVTVDGTQSQNGLFWRTLTFDLPELWSPACCFPDTQPDPC